MINTNGVETLYYGYADNLGSLIALTDQNGNVVEKYAYDPWGARRNPNDWTQAATHPSGGWGVITNRGYTGHEHLDMFAIINMNGRVYDPLTAMFFSPDPLVSSPGDWLGYNRYSYVMNNPLRYTDPSGYQPAPTEFEKQGLGGGGAYMYFPGELGDNKGYVGGFGNGANAVNPYNLNSWWNGYQNALSAGYLGGLNNFLDSYFNNVSKSNFNGSFNFSFKIGHYFDRSNAGGDLRGYVLPEINTIWKTVTINLNLSTPENWTNGIGVGLGAISASVGRAIQNELAYVNTTSLIQPTETMLKVGPANLLVSNTLSKTLTRVGVGLSLVSAAITINDAIDKGEWQGHHTADLIVNGTLTGISVVCPVAGFALGGLYFVGDIATQYYTGKSITENLFDQ